MVTSPTTFQGQTVTVRRRAKQGDQNFKQGEDMVLIRLQDGTERAVPMTEVQGINQTEFGDQSAKSQNQNQSQRDAGEQGKQGSSGTSRS
jgi:hypothetical protein